MYIRSLSQFAKIAITENKKIYGRILFIWLAHKLTFLLVVSGAMLLGRSWWKTIYMWDGKWYEALAIQGYWFDNTYSQSTIAFPPLYSFMGRGFWELGIPIKIGLLGISWVASLGAMLLLFNLLKRHYDAGLAEKVVLVMLFNPLGMVWSLPYSESLFLLILLIFWSLWDRNKIVWSGAVFGLLPLVRLTGCVFGLLFVLRFWRERKEVRWRYFAGGTIGSLGLLGWLLYMQIYWGSWSLPFVHQVAWLRSFYPFPGVLALHASQIIQFVISKTYSWLDFLSVSISLFPYIVDWGSILFLTCLLFLKCKELPKDWGWISVVYCIYVLSFPSFAVEHMRFIPALGAVRYLLVCFPLLVLVVQFWGHQFKNIFAGVFVLHLIYLSYFAMGMYIP